VKPGRAPTRAGSLQPHRFSAFLFSLSNFEQTIIFSSFRMTVTPKSQTQKRWHCTKRRQRFNGEQRRELRQQRRLNPAWSQQDLICWWLDTYKTPITQPTVSGSFPLSMPTWMTSPSAPTRCHTTVRGRRTTLSWKKRFLSSINIFSEQEFRSQVRSLHHLLHACGTTSNNTRESRALPGVMDGWMVSKRDGESRGQDSMEKQRLHK